MINILTHDGTFHSDEVFAVALLKKFKKGDINLIRTRDQELIEKAQEDRDFYVIDVGGEYNEKNKNFDHHQRNFEEKWQDGELLSSCGLIWKYLKRKGFLKNYDKDLLIRVEDELIKKIDIHDNGGKKWPLAGMVSMCNREENTNEDFFKAVSLALIYLDNTFYNESLNIIKNEDFEKDYKLYLDSEDKNIFYSSNAIKDPKILNQLSNEKDLYLIVYPQIEDNGDKKWYIHSINKYDESGNKFNYLVPEEYRGLAGEALERKSGIKGFLFVHKTGFKCGASSLKNAKKIANIIINSN